MLCNVTRDGEAHAGAGSSDVAQDSIQREHHLGQHDQRSGELDPLHCKAFQEHHRIDAAGQTHHRQFAKKMRDKLGDHSPPR